MTEETVRLLPVGMAEFETWSEALIEQCTGLADPESIKYVLATAIIHGPPDKDRFPDSYFLARIRKAAANQIASQVFQNIKQAQEARIKAAELANLAEVEKTN